MALDPGPEALACLTPSERLNFRLVHAVNRSRSLKALTTFLGRWLGMAWVEFASSNLSIAHHFERFQDIRPDRGVLLVSNHRSFFDLFAISGRLFRLYGMHHHVYFPVRSTFFYTNPLGLLVSIPVAMATMYPPILRDRSRRDWNRYATDLLVDLLQDPRTMVGYHPEGTRNKDPDPYSLLQAKPGCGELIHRSRSNVVPVFLQGFPRFAWHGPLINYLPRGIRPIWVHMIMGEPMSFGDLLDQPASPEVYQQISDRVMAEVRRLGEEDRRIRSARTTGARKDPEREDHRRSMGPPPR